MEMDVVVAGLVPAFESLKLKAIIARQEFVMLASCSATDPGIVADAREFWEQLENGCTAILSQIDALAELSSG
jgi:hypothetical protein